MYYVYTSCACRRTVINFEHFYAQYCFSGLSLRHLMACWAMWRVYLGRWSFLLYSTEHNAQWDGFNCNRG